MIYIGNSKEIIILSKLYKHIVLTLTIRYLHCYKIGNYKLHKLQSFLYIILKEKEEYNLYYITITKNHKLYYNLYFVHFLIPKTRKTIVLSSITKDIGFSNVLEFPYNLFRLEVY